MKVVKSVLDCVENIRSDLEFQAIWNSEQNRQLVEAMCALDPDSPYFGCTEGETTAEAHQHSFGGI